MPTFYETHYYNGGEFGFNEEHGEDYGRDFVLREYENDERDTTENYRQT